MPTTAENLRDLHLLHQRARRLRDRLSSGPKTLAARQAALATRQAEVEAARKALQDAKMHVKKHEHTSRASRPRSTTSRSSSTRSRRTTSTRPSRTRSPTTTPPRARPRRTSSRRSRTSRPRPPRWPGSRPRSKRFAAEVAALQQQIDEQSGDQKAQLRELEAAIIQAEGAIPAEHRDHYRRIVARYGADALAACEEHSCPGCYTSITPQMLNDLINRDWPHLLPQLRPPALYVEPEVSRTKRTAR